MFYDVELFKRKPEFGVVWIVATRGIKSIPNNKINSINIKVLCEEMIKFIKSKSTSPDKKFSLRLSSNLMIGALMILNKQCLILQRKLFDDLQETEMYLKKERHPQSTNFDLDDTSHQRTKVKASKKTKTKVGLKAIEATSEYEPLNVIESVPETLLLNTANKDSITLREDVPLTLGDQRLRDDDLGILPIGFLEDALNIFTEQPILTQAKSSSSSEHQPQLIQTVAQLHEEKEKTSPPAKRPRLLKSKDKGAHVLASQPEPVQAPTPVPVPCQPEEHIPTTLPEEPLDIIAPEEPIPAIPSAPLAQPEIRPIVEISKNKLTFKEPKKKRDNPFKKDIIEWEIENLPILTKYKTINLVKILRTDSLSNKSRRKSLSLEDIELRGQRTSSIEETSRNEYRISHHRNVHSLAKESGSLKRMQIEVPTEVSWSSQERQIGELPFTQPIVDQPFEAPLVDQPLEQSLVDQPSEQPAVEPHFEQIIVDQPLRQSTSRERTPEFNKLTERQQKILEIVRDWNFDNILTIDDIAEKPLNRLFIARAFQDLLDLMAKKYLILYPKDGSTELERIEKGPNFYTINAEN